VSSNLIARSSNHKRVELDRHQPSCFFFAEIAQLVEHATENCGVGSSSLPLGTFLFYGGSSNWQDCGLWSRLSGFESLPASH
jgi:hypothetical protein